MRKGWRSCCTWTIKSVDPYVDKIIDKTYEYQGFITKWPAVSLLKVSICLSIFDRDPKIAELEPKSKLEHLWFAAPCFAPTTHGRPCRGCIFGWTNNSSVKNDIFVIERNTWRPLGNSLIQIGPGWRRRDWKALGFLFFWKTRILRRRCQCTAQKWVK